MILPLSRFHSLAITLTITSTLLPTVTMYALTVSHHTNLLLLLFHKNFGGLALFYHTPLLVKKIREVDV
jgi:hypothetical protein